MRLTLIANHRSGTAPDAEQLEALLAADGADVRLTPIDAICDPDGGGLREATRALSENGRPDRIVVVGGDGSIGPGALLAAELRVPLAVVAAGTANDFARAKRLPLDIDEACALARAPHARTEHAELGLAAGRPFVNAAAAGLSVVAADAATPHKSLLGPLAYAVGALTAGCSASPLRCSVRCDGEERFVGRAWQVVVAVTGAFGGGSEIGGTSAADGMLDVAVVPAGSRAGLVRRAYGMRTGRLIEQADVAHDRAAVVELQIVGPAPQFNVDGELCRCDPARFTLHPEGFQTVAP